MSRLLLVLAAVVLVLLTAAPPARAHWADLAVADVRVSGHAATMTLTVPTGLVREADTNHDGRLDVSEVRAHAQALSRRFAAAIQVSADGETAPPEVVPSLAAPAGADLASAAGTSATLELRYRWQRPIDALSIHYALFLPGVTTARCLATISQGDRLDNVVFTPANMDFASAGSGGPGRQAASFVGLGIEHILTGYDHVLFLLCLLMLGGGLRYVLTIVTAFTVSHSLTLSLAVLNVITLPPRLVESAIALTIVYVAAENFWRKSLDRRWVVTMAFGLVHGFGFASALAETGLPRHNLVVSLASFNVGVEIGQIAIVALAYTLLGLVRERPWEGTFRNVVSAGVIGVALFWFGQRAF